MDRSFEDLLLFVPLPIMLLYSNCYAMCAVFVDEDWEVRAGGGRVIGAGQKE